MSHGFRPQIHELRTFIRVTGCDKRLLSSEQGNSLNAPMILILLREVIGSTSGYSGVNANPDPDKQGLPACRVLLPRAFLTECLPAHVLEKTQNSESGPSCLILICLVSSASRLSFLNLFPHL